MIYLIQAYLVLCVFFLAAKDADSYLLKDKTDNPLSAGRVKRWHRDGFILFLLYLVPLFYWDMKDWWKIGISALLLRASLFDIEFNFRAGLPASYLGGTAWTDRQLVKLFGVNGNLTKSGICLLLWAAFTIFNRFL